MVGAGRALRSLEGLQLVPSPVQPGDIRGVAVKMRVHLVVRGLGLHECIGSKIEDFALRNVSLRMQNAPSLVTGISVNGAAGVVPVNRKVRAIYIQNTTANAVTGGVNIGTTSGASDIASAVAVGANGLVTINAGGLSKQWFSATAAQTVFISDVSAWNSASLNVELLLNP